MVSLLLVWVSAAAAAWLLTPGVRRLATAHGVVDRPDGRRKLQAQAVALGGGVAIFAALCVGLLAHVCLQSRPSNDLPLMCACRCLAL